MGKFDLGINLAKKISTYVRTSGKSLLQIKPISKMNIEGLRYAPKLEGDILQLSKKSIQMTPGAIIDHGSLVMQTRLLPTRFQRDVSTGIEYARATRDDIFLAHSVSNTEAIENLTYLIEKSANGEQIYLSTSLINKHSSLFHGDGAYGAIIKNRSANITTAGYGQISNYKKTYEQFLSDINATGTSASNPHYVFIKNNTLKNLKESGIQLNDMEYVELFNKLKNYEYFDQIPNQITIGKQILNGKTIKNAIEKANIELAFNELNVYETMVQSLSKSSSGGFNNEIASLIDGVEALYARVDNPSEVAPEIITLAKQHKLKVILLGKPDVAKQISDIPEYNIAIAKLKEEFNVGNISIKEFANQKEILSQKYSKIVDEFNNKLKARTTLEQSINS